MTRQDVTFFGEVGAISSRALWNDSDDEDEQVGNEKKWTCSVVEGFSLTKFDVVFLSKSNVQNEDSRLGLISSVEVHQEDEKSKKLKLIDLYEIKNDSKSGWIVINQRTADKLGDSCVDILREILQNCFNTTTATILIVVTSTDGIENMRYLPNEHLDGNHSLFVALKNVIPNKVLPPTIISNPSEAVTFELCTVMNIASCILLVPDSNRSNFDIDSVKVTDSLKMVIKSLPGTSRSLSDSNIYT